MKTIRIVCFFLLSLSVQAQNSLDSLWSIWKNEELEDTVRLNAIQQYNWQGFLYGKPDSSFLLAQIEFDYAQTKNNIHFMSWALLTQGVTLIMRGNNSKAIKYYLKSLGLFKTSGDSIGIAGVLNNIGMMYYEQADYDKATIYHLQSLEIRERIRDRKGLAGSYSNLGDIYTNKGDFDKALDYYEKSLKIKKQINFKSNISSSFNQIGFVYFKKKEYQKALNYFNQCLETLDNIQLEPIYSTVLTNMGLTYLELNNLEQARSSCKEALGKAEKIINPNEQLKACDCLYNVQKASGNISDALIYFEKANRLRDSLHVVETSRELQSMEFEKKMLVDSIKQAEKERIIAEQHREEVRKMNKIENILIITSLFILIIAIGLWSRLRYIRSAKITIEKEKYRSENLLLNILPAEIAEELKIKGKADARNFDRVTILFTDFIEFTQTSEKLSASELVYEINVCFEAFDHILEKLKIEKIKTIGDSYMAAGGLPIPTNDSVKNTVLAALDMQAFICERKAKKNKSGETAFEMRLGIHTGPVVAGIVGVKKFQYDIWGDTVNTASRIENRGEASKVNISQATYEFIKGDSDFKFESRGNIEVKGKGEIEMWFVQSNMKKE